MNGTRSCAYRTVRLSIHFHDNFSAHISGTPNDLMQICIESFHANLAAHVQLLDTGIIENFKGHYRHLFVEQAVDWYDASITPTSIHVLNQLESMQIRDQIVETKTI